MTDATRSTGADLFPGFDAKTVSVGDVSLFVRTGGSGPPLVCLHGYPQTHVCWHRMAPALAEHFTVILPDLRGYGASDAPQPTKGHESYAKRTMAGDIKALMAELGHQRFHLMGHDRGARVAYRMALDAPEVVDKLVIVDIIPTIEVWSAFAAASANRSYHWTFLAQPAPLPETLIGAAPTAYLDMTLERWTQDKSLAVFDPTALAHYRALFDDPARISAVCEDYRAGATIDGAIDARDRAEGRTIPHQTLFLWGTNYLGQGGGNPLAVWQRWCDDVRGHAIKSGHFLHEENPTDTLAAVLPFLRGE